MRLITPTVQKIALRKFPEDKEWVLSNLQRFCEYMSEFMTESAEPRTYDRFCLAVLKIGKTNKSKFLQAIELGKTDYRDLLVAAGFANSLTAHEIWASKNE